MNKSGFYRFAALLSVACALTGCSALGGASGLFIKRTPVVLQAAQTNVVEKCVTNYVGVTSYLTNWVQVTAAVTNAATGQVTPASVQATVQAQTNILPVITKSLETVVLPAVTYNAASISPTLTGTVNTIGDVVPVPWASGAGHILLALGGVGCGVYNWFAARKASGQASDWRDAATAGVHGIESIRTAALTLPNSTYTPAVDAKVMSGIVALQNALGVQPLIADLVNTQTAKTKA